jgi:hypothetical protein
VSLLVVILLSFCLRRRRRLLLEESPFQLEAAVAGWLGSIDNQSILRPVRQIGEDISGFQKVGFITARKIEVCKRRDDDLVRRRGQDMAIFDGKPRQKANQNLPPREVPWVEK